MHRSTLLFTTLLFAQSASAVSIEQAQHLIVTSAALAPSFQSLATHRTQADVPSLVVALEDILATATPGRDDAEILRNYIKSLHALGNLRFVLFGGDASIVPVRLVHSDFLYYPTGVDLLSDLYFAGLSGDWDGDGDGIFGEPFTAAGAGDNADLDPDLAVGRAPVSSMAEASRFVAGIMSYDTLRESSHYASALMAAEVLFPADWTGGPINLDGAFFAERFRTLLQSHPYPMHALRLYENEAAYPGSSDLNLASLTAQLGSGDHGFVFYTGIASTDRFSMGNAEFTVVDADALSNAPNFHVLCALSSFSCAPSSVSVARHLLTNPNGGSAAVIGFSEAALPSTASDYFDVLLSSLSAQSAVPLGDAWRDALHAHAASTVFNTSTRWTALTLSLLGDPAMPFRSEVEPVPMARISFSQWRARFGE